MLCRCFIFVQERTFINTTFTFLSCGFSYYFLVSVAWQDSLWEYLLCHVNCVVHLLVVSDKIIVLGVFHFTVFT